MIPKRRYRSSGPGNRWVHVIARCVHYSKDPKLAAHSMMENHRYLKLFIGNKEYELPYRGLDQELNYYAHIKHCIDLHKAFYNEQS